jgi:hypothetical protein
MVNDDNDKWSDNGDLPINPEYNSNQMEDEQSKRKVLKNQMEDEQSKRKVLKNQINDQKDMSMEELMNGSKNKDRSIKNTTYISTRPNAKVYTREEQIKNMTNTPAGYDKKVYTAKESAKVLTKNGRFKESVNIATKEESEKEEKIKDLTNIATKEESSKKEKIKDLANIVTKEESSKKEKIKDLANIVTKEESEKETLSTEIQELKDQLKKLKEETKEPQYIKDLSKYIKNLDSNIGQLATGLKTFTDAKSWEAISRGKLEVRRYANYYDIHGTITTAAASDPHDFDSAVYNVERIFESLERYAEIIYVTNDGTDNLYVIVSHGGRTRFSTEAIIYPGEVKFYLNIYEIRLRSPTLGLPYRITEYRISTISEISTIPIEKANLQNQALPAINTNWLTTDITPTNYPTTFMIEVAVSVAGNFNATVTRSGNTQVVTFNIVSGPVLIAGGIYIFDLLVHNGDSVNFTYSATGGTIQLLRVQELDSASA